MPARAVDIPYSHGDRHGCYYTLPLEGILLRVFTPELVTRVCFMHNGNSHLAATKGVFPIKIPLSLAQRCGPNMILLEGIRALPSIKVLIDDMPAIGSMYDFGTFRRLILCVQPTMTFPAPSAYSRAQRRWIPQLIIFADGFCCMKASMDPQHYFGRASL